MKEMKRVVFKIDKDLSDRFDEIAVADHRSRSNLLETLIIRLIAEKALSGAGGVRGIHLNKEVFNDDD